MNTQAEDQKITSLDVLARLRALFELPQGVCSLDLHVDGESFPTVTLVYEPHTFIKASDYEERAVTRRYILIPIDQHDASASQQRQG